jgi:hypothetical protein
MKLHSADFDLILVDRQTVGMTKQKDISFSSFGCKRVRSGDAIYIACCITNNPTQVALRRVDLLSVRGTK